MTKKVHLSYLQTKDDGIHYHKFDLTGELFAKAICQGYGEWKIKLENENNFIFETDAIQALIKNCYGSLDEVEWALLFIFQSTYDDDAFPFNR